VKPWIAVIVLLAALAPAAPCLEPTAGIRAGAGGSIFFGSWVDGLRGELGGLGAATVTDRVYVSWRVGGWIDIPLLEYLSLRVEPTVGPVGGALLAADGYDMLVGVTALEIALPVLAAAHVRMPVGEIVLGAGVFVGGAVSLREVRNDGTVRTEGALANAYACVGVAGGAGYAFPVGTGAITIDLRALGSLYSIASPQLDGVLNTLSVELTAGWALRPRGAE
jgi:hypothetical protein